MSSTCRPIELRFSKITEIDIVTKIIKANPEYRITASLKLQHPILPNNLPLLHLPGPNRNRRLPNR